MTYLEFSFYDVNRKNNTTSLQIADKIHIRLLFTYEKWQAKQHINLSVLFHLTAKIAYVENESLSILNKCCTFIFFN